MQNRRFSLGCAVVLGALAFHLVGCIQQTACAKLPAEVDLTQPVVAGKTDSFSANVREAIQKNPIGAEEKTKLFALFENADHTVNLIQTRGAVPAHHHVEHDELVMVLEGKGTFTIEGQNREVSAGDILIIPRNAVHSYVHQGDGITAVVSVFSPKFDPKDRIMAEKKP